jgi:hypothetical protein
MGTTKGMKLEKAGTLQGQRPVACQPRPLAHSKKVEKCMSWLVDMMSIKHFC